MYLLSDPNLCIQHNGEEVDVKCFRYHNDVMLWMLGFNICNLILYFCKEASFHQVFSRQRYLIKYDLHDVSTHKVAK